MRADAKQAKMFYIHIVHDEDLLLVFQSGDEWLTRAQICERLWRSKSPELIHRIERLVDEKLLERREDVFINGRLMYWYKRVLP